MKAARGITLAHRGHLQNLDLRGISGGTELLEPLPANLAHRVHRGFQEFARIEFAWRLMRDAAKFGGHSETAIGIDVHLAHPVLDAAHDLLDRDAISLTHGAAIGVEAVLEVLRNR